MSHWNYERDRSIESLRQQLLQQQEQQGPGITYGDSIDRQANSNAYPRVDQLQDAQSYQRYSRDTQYITYGNSFGRQPNTASPRMDQSQETYPSMRSHSDCSSPARSVNSINFGTILEQVPTGKYSAAASPQSCPSPKMVGTPIRIRGGSESPDSQRRASGDAVMQRGVVLANSREASTERRTVKLQAVQSVEFGAIEKNRQMFENLRMERQALKHQRQIFIQERQELQAEREKFAKEMQAQKHMLAMQWKHDGSAAIEEHRRLMDQQLKELQHEKQKYAMELKAQKEAMQESFKGEAAKLRMEHSQNGHSGKTSIDERALEEQRRLVEQQLQEFQYEKQKYAIEMKAHRNALQEAFNKEVEKLRVERSQHDPSQAQPFDVVSIADSETADEHIFREAAFAPTSPKDHSEYIHREAHTSSVHQAAPSNVGFLHMVDYLLNHSSSDLEASTCLDANLSKGSHIKFCRGDSTLTGHVVSKLEGSASYQVQCHTDPVGTLTTVPSHLTSLGSFAPSVGLGVEILHDWRWFSGFIVALPSEDDQRYTVQCHADDPGMHTKVEEFYIRPLLSNEMNDLLNVKLRDRSQLKL